jgi:hypothetical protein
MLACTGLHKYSRLIIEFPDLFSYVTASKPTCICFKYSLASADLSTNGYFIRKFRMLTLSLKSLVIGSNRMPNEIIKFNLWRV